MIINETPIRERLVSFIIGSQRFEAYHVPPSRHAPGLVIDEDRWVLSKIVYQSHRSGQPVKRATHERRGRRKRVGVFDTLDECRGYFYEKHHDN